MIGWALAGAVTAGYLLSHDGVQKIAAWAGEQVTVERLSAYITIGGALIGAAAVGSVARGLRGRPGGRLIALYSVITLLLIALIYNTMFMVNTEAIHFPQYALLGMVLLPLTGRVTEAITWVTLFGAFDEAWQYWVLNMGNRVDSVYFDFNDIVLNLLGGAFGVLLVLALLADDVDAEPGGYSWRDYLRSTAFRTTAAFVAVGGVLWLAGRLTLFPDPRAWIVLARTGPRPSYWETSYWGKTTHVLLPLEGLPVIGALLALYLPLDRRLRLRLD